MYDLIVIGTGPGGYHAAIRAAQLGLNVAAIESGDVGGVCLNTGCIPTKALLHAAAEIEHARQAAEYGLDFGEPAMDLAKLADWRDGIVNKLAGGVAGLLRGKKVDLHRGRAQFVDANTIDVDGERLQAKHFIIATGSAPAQLNGFDPDHACVVDSTGALRIEDGVPERFLAVGGGAIGLEFAAVMNRFGAKVTVAEVLPHVLAGSDEEMTGHYADLLKRQGIDLRTATRAADVQYGENTVDVQMVSEQGDEETLTFDKVLVAVGRRPRSAELGLDTAGVGCDERGFITVDDAMRTSVDNIYAIGDVAGAPLLAHKAMKEGLVAAANVAGQDQRFDYQIPNVVYTEPEWASIGMTEAGAKERGINVRIGRFPLSASGRAMTLGDASGQIKVVAEDKTDLLLGVHIVGPGASELIAEAALALEMAATMTDIRWTVHPHPTLSEGVMEAAEQLYGEAIHLTG